MKQYAIIALAACSLGLVQPVCAQEEQEVPQSLSQETLEFYDSWAKELLSACKEIKDALSTVTDKASADAAAPKVYAATKRVDALMADIRNRDDYTDAVDEYLNKHYPEGKGCVEDLEELIGNLEEVDFYGSSALECAADGEQEVELTEEDLAFYDGLVAQYAAKAEELVAILESVKDKESADAAAEKGKPISDEMWAIAEKVRRHGGTGDAVRGTLEKRYKDMISLAEKLEDLGDKFMEQDFFGSESLKSIFILSEEYVEDEAGD